VVVAASVTVDARMSWLRQDESGTGGRRLVDTNASFVAQDGNVVMVFTRPTSGFLSSSAFTKVVTAYGSGVAFREHTMKKVWVTRRSLRHIAS
jgi:hypothetical protein